MTESPFDALDAEPGARAKVVRLSEVKAERVRWLWRDYLPLGKLVMLDGDPGVGKSTVMADLAARVTTGTAMPDGTVPVKGAVLILSAEDGLADTIRPRIDAAGGDPGQVITITGVEDYDDDGNRAIRPVSLPGDLPQIEAAVREHGVVLVIIDVLMAYLDGAVNSHRDQDVRRALHPAAAMAEGTGCCVVMLRHLNKTSGATAVYRGGGSVGIGGAARAVFMCGRDPDDDTGRRRILAPVKCNLAAEEDAASLAYRLVGDELHGCARVQWDGTSELGAETLLAEAADPEARTAIAEAAAWLRDYLAGEIAGAPGAEVLAAGKKAGHAERTLRRAVRRAGAETVSGGFPRRTTWQLRSAASQPAREAPPGLPDWWPPATDSDGSPGQDDHGE